MNTLFLGAATARFVVGSDQDADVVVRELRRASTPFTAEPHLDGVWHFTIKTEFVERWEQIVGGTGLNYQWVEPFYPRKMPHRPLPKVELNGWIAITRFEKSLPDEGVPVHAHHDNCDFAFAAVRLGSNWKMLGTPTPTGIAPCPAPQAWAPMGPTYHHACDSVTAEWIRGYPEDSDHENGNYRRPCSITGLMFRGHKRRVASKESLTIQTESDE